MAITINLLPRLFLYCRTQSRSHFDNFAIRRLWFVILAFLLLPCASAMANTNTASYLAANPATTLDKIAAVVNDEVIMLSDVRRLALQLKSRNKTNLSDQQLVKEALDSLILIRLQAQKARELGITVEKETLNQALQGIAKQNNLTLDQLRVALKREGIDYDLFKDNLNEKIMIETLRKRQRGRKQIITEQEVDDLIQSESAQLNKDVQYHLQDVIVPQPAKLSVAQFNRTFQRANQLRNQLLADKSFLSPVLAKKFGATAHDLGWQRATDLKPSFVRALSLMESGEISPVIHDAEGFHILKLVEQKGGLRKVTQQVRARHILIPADTPNARLKAIQLRQQIQAGGDFASLAKQYSADKGSAAKGGDLGLADPSGYVKPFADAVRSLPINTLSQPIQTRFGWHLIEVLERKLSDQTRDALVAQAQAVLSERKQSGVLKNWLQSLRENAYIEYRL